MWLHSPFDLTNCLEIYFTKEDVHVEIIKNGPLFHHQIENLLKFILNKVSEGNIVYRIIKIHQKFNLDNQQELIDEIREGK